MEGFENSCGIVRHWNDFLVVQARDFMPILCNQSRASPTLLRNAMHNQRTASSLVSAQPPADIARATRCKVA